jgi:hypothetical protein
MLKKPETVEETVVDVQLVDGFKDKFGQYNRYDKNHVQEILGYDLNGMPIVESYVRGMYEVTVVNPQGNIRVFQHFGKPYQIGFQQNFRKDA